MIFPTTIYACVASRFEPAAEQRDAQQQDAHTQAEPGSPRV